MSSVQRAHRYGGLRIMPAADATPRTPSHSASSIEARGEGHESTRSLAEIGVETVLGAMIEQKRRSQPAVQELESPPESHDLHAHDALEPTRSPAAATAPSEVFLKSR